MSTQDIRWLKSMPASAVMTASKINAETGVIEDVVMVQEGEAKGHGLNLEGQFVLDLVDYAQQTFPQRGLKGRFGHPGASDNTMGMQMGYFRNIRKRKNAEGKMQAVGNLHLLEASDDSPTNPGMRSYILKMAAESPDFLMSSIVFNAGGYYQRKPNGNKHPLEIETDPFESRDFRNLQKEWGKIYVEFGTLHFCDLVDNGAATDNLFAAQSNPHLFVSQVEMFLSEHSHLLDFFKSNPGQTMAFLSRMGLKLPSPLPTYHNNMSKLTDWLFGASTDKPEGDEADLTALKSDFDEAKKLVQSLQTVRTDLAKRLEDADEQITALKASVAVLEANALALRNDLEAANSRVKELETQPAAPITNGRTTPGGEPKKGSAWEQFKAKHNIQ